MALTITDGTATISTTEYFLASASTVKTDQTDDCLLSMWINIEAIAAADVFRIKLYEKVSAAAAQQSMEIGVLSGAQVFPWLAPMLFVGHAWEVSVTKISGTNRTVRWSLRKAT